MNCRGCQMGKLCDWRGGGSMLEYCLRYRWERVCKELRGGAQAVEAERKL